MERTIEQLIAALDENQYQADILNEYFAGRSSRSDRGFMDAWSKTHSLKDALNGLGCDDEMTDVLLKQGISPISVSIVTANSFWKAVPKNEKRIGKWLFGKRRYQAGELFLCDETTCDENGIERNPLGFFESPVEVPVIYQNGRPWMSLIPHEIATMKNAIDAAAGRVLTYGLGLGYFAVMASLKDDVQSVDIVERDRNAIELFQKYIQPLFPTAKKIRIIQMDAFRHFSGLRDGQYDFAFVDIWHNGDDGWRPYVKFVQSAKRLANLRLRYWIEKTILAYLRRAATIVLAEVADGAQPNDFSVAANNEEKLINALYAVLRENDFKTDLSDEVLRKYSEILRI